MSTLVLCPIGDGTRAQDLRRGVGWEVNGGRTPFELRTNPADLVIEDPGFSQSIAPEHALLEGLQVFACALDGLINANARTETDEVFLRTLAHMPALMRRLAGKTVDPDALEALFWLAAEVEAVAPRPGLAVLGAVADALYFRFKLHRGLSSATMLVPLLDRLAADDAEREKAIGRALGCETSPAAASIAGLLTELGIARRLSFAIGPEAVDNVERALAGHDDAVNFPRWIGEADLPGMLRQGLRTVTSDGPGSRH